MKIKAIQNAFRNLCTSLINHCFVGHHNWAIKRTLLRWSGAEIGSNVRVVGPIYYTAKLHIGDDTFIGKTFSVHGCGHVTIGSQCDIAPEVTILTGSHEIGSPTQRAGKGKSYQIVIENGCWIGARTTIIGNTTIGTGSVVGCCSLVRESVAPNSMVAGVPAQIKRTLEENP